MYERTVVRFEVTMQDLGTLILSTFTVRACARASGSRVSIRVVTVAEGKQDLHEVVPYDLLGYRFVQPLRLLDRTRKVPAPTILHQNVENTSIPVDVSVVISYNMLVLEILQNIANELWSW